MSPDDADSIVYSSVTAEAVFRDHPFVVLSALSFTSSACPEP